METEQQLQEAVKGGDRQAMRRLYERYKGYAMSIGLRYIPDGDDVEDVVQDSFVTILTSIQRFSYQGEGSLKSWLGSLKQDPSFLKTTLDDVKRASGFIAGKIEEVRLDVREIQTVSVDVNDDGIADLSISDAIPDKKQGEDERDNVESIAAKSITNEQPKGCKMH